MSSEASTAYLPDDVAGDSSERCKRRRMAVVVSPAVVVEDFQQLVFQEFLGSDSLGDSFDDLDFLFHESAISDQITNNFSCPINQFNTSEEKETEQKDKEEEVKESEEKSIRWKKNKKLAYPFDVLKPTKLEGDSTLAEINERILRRPTRPVRHPVGEFACLPWVPDGGGGPGLSGKEVVGITRIYTKGRGSISVIRTRG